MILAMVLAASFCAPIMALLPAFVKDVYAGGARAIRCCSAASASARWSGRGLRPGEAGAGPRPGGRSRCLSDSGSAEARDGHDGNGIVRAVPPALRGDAGPHDDLRAPRFVGGLNRVMAAILASTPDAMRGRVSSYHMLCFMAGMPLGARGWVACWRSGRVSGS